MEQVLRLAFTWDGLETALVRTRKGWVMDEDGKPVPGRQADDLVERILAWEARQMGPDKRFSGEPQFEVEVITEEETYRMKVSNLIVNHEVAEGSFMTTDRATGQAMPVNFWRATVTGNPYGLVISGLEVDRAKSLLEELGAR